MSRRRAHPRRERLGPPARPAPPTSPGPAVENVLVAVTYAALLLRESRARSAYGHQGCHRRRDPASQRAIDTRANIH
jgi:hypothetical protein